MSFTISTPASAKARLTAKGWDNEVQCSQEYLYDTHHVALVLMNSFEWLYSTILFVTVGLRIRLLKKKIDGLATNMSCCLMTILERILREELTTAAQVSSADDSMARTLKWRLVEYVKDCRQSEEHERRNMALLKCWFEI